MSLQAKAYAYIVCVVFDKPQESQWSDFLAALQIHSSKCFCVNPSVTA